jgi:nucleoredoxin
MEETQTQAEAVAPPVQAGPLIDLLGPSLLSLDMIDETRAQYVEHTTSDALRGKKVIGLYFSADWCGPCRQFTPELVSFYDKMNKRRGKNDQFEIVWVSRCRDVDAYGQYFTSMNWLALPPDEAMGQRGQMLMDKYKVKGIPSLVLLDDLGELITTDARNKIPADKAGIGFP